MSITTTQPAAALHALQNCRAGLAELRLDAVTAAGALAGARAARATELAEKTADCIAHAERLAFVVAGDLATEQAVTH